MLARRRSSEKQAMMISGHKTRSMIDRYQIIDARDIELAGQKMAAYEIAQKQLRAKVRAVGQKVSAEPGNRANAYKGV